MSSNFGPVFTSISAISLALVWKFAPETGQKLPGPLRDAIYSTVRSICPANKSGQIANVPSPAPAPAVATDVKPAVPAAAPAEKKAAPEQRQAPAAAPASARNGAAKAPAKASGTVTKTAQNPTGSPFLEPAAKALREYKQLSEELEKKRQGMGMAEQRQIMKKLNTLNERVEFYNRKHREWKKSHPAASGSAR